MVLIHEKISALLEQRRLKKRDLARALGVSPQTATDICKGRSAITLPHLRKLVAYFELRADFWLDEQRLTPEELDRVGGDRLAAGLNQTGLPQLDDPERWLRMVRSFVLRHRTEFQAMFPDLSPAERKVLGLSGPEHGAVGQLAEG
ncbi:MAG: helix-turn-helix domain-containing protein [Planctomycetes bacterium]|nr:helix-turn-helix domain-containing protein [Planctomycetota bacterium]